mgnify:CR=1 FL=1
MATNDSMIQVKDLKKHYKMGTIRALDGVTVNINKGDVMAVIGPSRSEERRVGKECRSRWSPYH